MRTKLHFAAAAPMAAFVSSGTVNDDPLYPAIFRIAASIGPRLNQRAQISA
ncbi:hypothetical protein KL867_17220 [Ruegeria litorea]|uniref:Uncharacterized protein n=1 Tax=Falsiruegeria litorea TaxID=1280831 RepID=A0ABS5WW17_9RHOB|nr:hypothetical protein [Falsiruegeria litorea]MBT3142814.1 hypothetical protein [Falsiruegeria litorea]